MNRKLKNVLLFSGFLVVLGTVLWFPYRIRGIPEWRITVFDNAGNTLAGVQVAEGWTNPAGDKGYGITDVRNTDLNGVVAFPPRVVRNRLVLGKVRTEYGVSAWVCLRGQIGIVNWRYEKAMSPPSSIIMKEGPCWPNVR